ncbi:uncharacterized protein LOC110024543 isoform X2 [Phalaenopsis equestris]|uniref:uncharacterized protein LOC110024543 isoform X2 n=1 Tax=Phalaenopsis equestris TaxID=78828 RepID=UPI0009E5654C|nr:uncharacterized protein LOC110024543 isoform X2 [Phalaenopsis equestris]
MVGSEISDPPSPFRAQRGGEEEERGRPRHFDAKAKARCWQFADVVAGRHPERWRRDSAGNVVCKRFYNCQGCLCFEYDHVIPYSKGGESTAENCQILQTRVNRLKADKAWVDEKELQGFSCDIKFTGHECRCRTVAEMLGKVKPKKPLAACKLPYEEANRRRDSTRALPARTSHTQKLPLRPSPVNFAMIFRYKNLTFRRIFSFRDVSPGSTAALLAFSAFFPYCFHANPHFAC